MKAVILAIAIMASSCFAAAPEYEAGEKAIYHLGEAYRLLDDISVKDKEKLRLRIFYVGEQIKDSLKKPNNQNNEEKR